MFTLKHLDIIIIMELIALQHHDREVTGDISFVVVADTGDTTAHTAADI